jgi:hypothetical protein
MGYLLLAVLMHVAWRKLVLLMDGTDGTYLLSVALFYVLAGGVGLGMYHFLQDSAFLPSNVANVAMLWGVYFWIAGLPAPAGACLGLAGAFHINHAITGMALWFGATAFQGPRAFSRAWWVGMLALVLLCAVQIVPSIHPVLSRSGTLSTHEYVELFVHLRHPHHFDPLSWHWGIWLAFLIPLPLAFIAARCHRTDAVRRAGALFCLYASMVVLALLTAGFWFLGETFVQLNLYRFSIYPKLLSCVAAAWLLWDAKPKLRPYVVGSLAVVAVAVVAVAVSSGLLAAPNLRNPIAAKGLEGDDAAYMSVVAWARENTPKDAIFLVPPDEQSFRVHAQRAIVVNFKGVPQLSAELPEWRDRLENVLDLDEGGLLALPRPMGRTLAAIRSRYDALGAEHLFRVARRYDARYVVLTHHLNDAGDARLVHADSTGRYFLYDLSGR